MLYHIIIKISYTIYIKSIFRKIVTHTKDHTLPGSRLWTLYLLVSVRKLCKDQVK